MKLKELNLTNEELRSLIPNVIHEVEGEALLVDKLKPWLESATTWLADNIAGSDFNLPDSLLPHAKKIIVYKAFAEAVPSLDVTLSPAGFAVISTEGRAPASKERVERLIASLNSFVDANLPPFLGSLLKIEAFRESLMGDYWLGTFMLGLDDAQSYKKDKDLLSTYKLMREKALFFQNTLEQKYLGKNLLRKIRASVYEPVPDEGNTIWHMLHRAVMRYIVYSDRGYMYQDEHDLLHRSWHVVQPILMELRSCDELYTIWEAEMGDKLKTQPFKNNIKGGFFF